jgi:HK97 family phage major capsid protein|nr:MAG TPA: Major capsid protein [Caudoviricetes sp.]
MALSTTKIDVNRGTTGVALPSVLVDTVIQGVREGSAVMQLANRLVIPGSGITMNVITGDPEPAWTVESTEKTVSEPTFANKVMQPYKLAVIVPFSDQFRRDEAALYDAIVSRVPDALAKKFDETVFFGTAPGTNFDTLASADAIDLQADPYGALVEGINSIAVAGGNADGIVLSPQANGIIMSARHDSGAGDPVFPNYAANSPLFGIPTLTRHAAYKAGSSAANTVGFIGDWSKTYYGIVQDITIKYSEQASLNDGTNTIHLWQRNMFALLCEMEVGFVVGDEDCFARFTDTYPAA